MKFIKIENYICSQCGNDDYKAISLEPVVCICSKCGKQIDDSFKIEIEEIEED